MVISCYILGFAEAPRKDVAQLAAALDLITKVKLLYPNMIIPDCEIPRGCLANPNISDYLYTFMWVNEIPEPEVEYCKELESGETDKTVHVC